MLGDGKWNSGDQGSFFKYQYGVLKLLESINNAVAVLGPDNETRTTRYEVIAGPTPPGAGYSIGDFLVRFDIINTATGTIVSTIWFNETLQTTLVGAGNPNPVDLTPVSASLSVTVLNPFNLEATQLLIQGLLTTIDATLVSILADTTNIANNIDVGLSTRNAEATQLQVLADTTSLDTKTNNDYGPSAGAIRVVLADPNTVTPQAITSVLQGIAVGSVAAGSTSAGFTTDSTFVGTINGVARNSSTFYGFEAAPGKTLPAIPWTVTAGNVIIDTIV